MKNASLSQTSFLHRIKSQFHITESDLDKFTGFPGAVKKINFTVQKTDFCIIFYENDNWVVKIKVFTLADPSRFYKNKNFSGESELRCNKPYILAFSYDHVLNETWTDVQLPHHDRGVDAIIEVITKVLYLLCRVYHQIKK